MDGAELVPQRRSSAQKRRDHRTRLCERQDWKCYWCGRTMVEPNPRGGKQPPLAATIDHLDSRLSPKRGTFGPLNGQQPHVRHVAACYDCNHRRGREEIRALGKDGQLRRSFYMQDVRLQEPLRQWTFGDTP